MKISALVLTKNVKPLLGDCLASLAWVDELVVVDDESRDGSLEMARSHGAKLFTRRLDSFDAQRNYGLDQCTGEWVLVVDADERLTPDGIAEIRVVLAESRPEVGYRLPRDSYFLGRKIRGCGWSPDYVLRLFRREGVRYAGRVHEGVEIDGPVGILRHPLQHFTQQTIWQCIEKTNQYTELAVPALYAKGRRATLVDLLLHPPFTFLKLYLLKLGIRDGMAGFAISMLNAYSVFVKYLKLWYYETEQRLSPPEDERECPVKPGAGSRG